jgi:hypothetical protein
MKTKFTPNRYNILAGLLMFQHISSQDRFVAAKLLWNTAVEPLCRIGTDK